MNTVDHEVEARLKCAGMVPTSTVTVSDTNASEVGPGRSETIAGDKAGRSETIAGEEQPFYTFDANKVESDWLEKPLPEIGQMYVEVRKFINVIVWNFSLILHNFNYSFLFVILSFIGIKIFFLVIVIYYASSRRSSTFNNHCQSLIKLCYCQSEIISQHVEVE